MIGRGGERFAAGRYGHGRRRDAAATLERGLFRWWPSEAGVFVKATPGQGAKECMQEIRSPCSGTLWPHPKEFVNKVNEQRHARTIQ